MSRRRSLSGLPETPTSLPRDLIAKLRAGVLTVGDLADALAAARTMDAAMFEQVVGVLAGPPGGRTKELSPAAEIIIADEQAPEKFAPAHKRMRATARQKLILKQLAKTYGTGAAAMRVLCDLARMMRYELPSEADLKVAGHYAGHQHTAALIAIALFAEPFDLWPKILGAAGAAQGIYARDYAELCAARRTVLGASHAFSHLAARCVSR